MAPSAEDVAVLRGLLRDDLSADVRLAALGALARASDHGPRKYLTPGEAGRSLHVSAKTIDRWANGGGVPCVFTLGGHRRFRPEDIDVLVEEMADRGRSRSA